MASAYPREPARRSRAVLLNSFTDMRSKQSFLEVTKPIKIVLPGEQAVLVPLFVLKPITNVRI